MTSCCWKSATRVDKSRLQLENIQLRRALKRYDLPNVVGKSEKMHKVMDLITQVAASRATVLITGESGTGKELVAKTIHATSPRADRPFVPVNTGSMPVDLLESTLFGHVKGAFTSAIATKRGLFEVANQGTIFFDEIGTVGVETQTKLLRVIQEREFMRLGGTENIKVDVRILAATNADLRKMVVDGRFREDLFYRLNVITLTLPPLRDRKEDIPQLADHFLRKFSAENSRAGLQFTPEALKVMMDYSWPGNVRELENAVERAVVLSSGSSLGAELLPEQLFQNGAARDGIVSGGKPSTGARCLRLWKAVSAALFSTCSRAPTGARPKPPSASKSLSPPSTRKSNACRSTSSAAAKMRLRLRKVGGKR